ncbi:MAG: hypothetical protein ACOCXQ_01965 [Patescibacteria group bacterium]
MSGKKYKEPIQVFPTGEEELEKHEVFKYNRTQHKFKSVVDCLLAAQAEELDVDDLSTAQIWQLVDHMKPSTSR